MAYYILPRKPPFQKAIHQKAILRSPSCSRDLKEIPRRNKRTSKQIVEKREGKSRRRAGALNRHTRTRSGRCRCSCRTRSRCSRRGRGRRGTGLGFGARGRRIGSCCCGRRGRGRRRRFAARGNSTRSPASFSARGSLRGPSKRFGSGLKGGESFRSLDISPLLQMERWWGGKRTLGLRAKTIPPIQWSSTEQ